MSEEHVKRDRVGVLASTIIRELASAKLQAIRNEDVTPPERPIVVTPQLKRHLLDYAIGKRKAANAEKRVEAAGYRIIGDSDGGYKLAWPYRRHDAERAARVEHKQHRQNAVRELRTNALIDLVTLDPKQAKAAVSRFRRDVEAI